MGSEVSSRTFTRDDRQRYREKMQRSLDALATMLAEDTFSFPRRQMGLEIELNLVDDAMRPAMANSEVLEKIDDPSYTLELGQQNLEINVPPRELAGGEMLGLEDELRQSLDNADSKANDVGANLAMIGLLPTLRERHFDRKWLSDAPRYALLNDTIFAARGEEMVLHMEGPAMPGKGPEKLLSYAESILPEAACTSVQLHLQVEPTHFAAHWNAAQCLAGVQVAIAANSAFLLGKALWHETRIPLFQQATDTRPDELKNQGVRPRVWFGERWITSIFDLFEENVRYFPSLLPETDDEDPIEILEAGGAPRLSELRLHNGTIWRWNRPVYDVVDGVPHLRVENRVLPAGPTVIDVLANGALFYGLVRSLVDHDRPVWTQMSFSAAEDNFHAAARDGIDARVYWPGVGEVPVTELVLRKLLPLAHEGLDAWGVPAQDRDRLLGVIEQRCISGRNGASWQVDTVRRLEETTQVNREQALREMTRRYASHMHSNEPVHTWPAV